MAERYPTADVAAPNKKRGASFGAPDIPAAAVGSGGVDSDTAVGPAPVVAATRHDASVPALPGDSEAASDGSGIDGAEMRKARRNAGLSLQQLAELAGVSTSLLSQLERGLATPSLASLRRISASLRVSIFQLLQESDASPHRVVRSDSRRKVLLKTEGISYELLSPDTKHMLEVWLGRIDVNELEPEPSQHRSPEPSQHPSEEHIHVLTGQMEITIGTEVYVLGPHDSVQYDGNWPHKIRNIGTSRLEFISALTPPTL